ncbi:MAG: hypothetical protein PVI86_14255 [Phycisphaerae bacterium]|jgi:hypothetical protein
MVGILQGLIMVIVAQQGPSTMEEIFPRTPPPDIVGVHKVTQSEAVLKPCQAFTVVFEITLASEAVRTQWPKVARKISNVVRVNGHDYRNQIADSSGSTNNVCVFELLWPQPVGREPPLRSSETALISATCQFALRQRTCLFGKPGEYRLEFFFGERTVETTVEVLPPTHAEQAIVDELNTLPMLLFFADPTDRQYATPENIRTVETLLAVPTDYSRMLSLTVGVAKGRRVGRPLWSDMADEQKREELRERFALVAPVLEGELDTRLEGLAASELFNTAAQLGRLETDPQKRAEFAKVREDVLPKLAACPLVPHEQALAKALCKQTKKTGE